MLSFIKYHFEKAVVAGLVVVILSASIISWGKILSEKDIQNEEKVITELETQQASNQLKKGVMVFSGLMIVVAEYFKMKDDK